MSLSADIKKAFFKSMDEDVLDDVQKKKLERMSKDLSKAIIDFLTNQTWTITEMKALLEVEEMETSTTLLGDVLPTVTVATTGGPTNQAGSVTAGTRGVKLPPLNLRKFGGQGGSMSSKGHAYIGNNPVDSAETNERNTKVKLLKQNIRGK